METGDGLNADRKRFWLDNIRSLKYHKLNNYAYFIKSIHESRNLRTSDSKSIIMVETDTILAIGSFLSGIGAVITAMIIYFKMNESNKITRESLQETKRINQLELLKNRPHFVIDRASYDVHDDFIILNADLENIGNTTANNLRFAFIAKNHFFGEEIIPNLLKTKEEHLFTNHLGSISSKGRIHIDPSYPFQFKTNIVCMALWLMYDFFDEKNHEEIHMLVFEKGVSPHTQFTIDENTIHRIRNRDDQ